MPTRQTRAAGRRAPAEAAVLAPVYRDRHGVLRLVVVRRADGGLHGGQIALPGGKREAGDRSLERTALRECHEEIGLAPRAVELLGPLPRVETLTTGFRIVPFLGRIERPGRWRPQAGEIVEVLEPAIDDLLDPAAHGRETRRYASWPEPREIAFYRIGPYKLWGATYRIVHPLLPRLAAGEWSV